MANFLNGIKFITEIRGRTEIIKFDNSFQNSPSSVIRYWFDSEIELEVEM